MTGTSTTDRGAIAPSDTMTSKMNTNTREKLADAYFDALDAPDYESLRSVFATDIVYRYPDATPLEGIETAIRFFEEDKPTSDTDHDVTRYVHGEDATVAEGFSTGVVDGDPFESYFCDVLEFTEDEERISDLAVYARSEPARQSES